MRVAISIVALWVLLVSGGPAAARDLVLPRTGEAALAQPMVVLAFGDRPTGTTTQPSRTSKHPGNLEDLPDDLPALAILDTGASGHVLSAGTATRFAVAPESGSRYFESGMSGDHAMAVSRPIDLAVTDLESDADADDGRSSRRPAAFRLADQRLLLNDAPTDLEALMQSPGSLVDVVGMPLIRERVVEIMPTGASTGPSALAVRLAPSAAGLAVDAWVPLALLDFNRRDPRNRGPAPSLATNPVLAVATVRGAAEAEGQWLFDTGAACTMISTATARRLDLVDATGHPIRPVAFRLPVGGVGGGSSDLPGFRLDRLTLTADDGRRLVFPDAAVVVHDVTTKRADGTTVTLDGVLGMNLLLPSGSGITMLGAATELPSPFARIVIDVARDRLGFRLAN